MKAPVVICKAKPHKLFANCSMWPVALVLLFLGLSAQAAEPPRVVVGIAPIHSLVAGVMAGVAEPRLLVRGNVSPHAYMLKPSQVRRLHRADLVVWVGESVESFLPRVLRNLSPTTQQIKLTDLPAMVLLSPREGGLWREQGEGDHEHYAEHHEHGSVDGHLWLDPQNAKVIVAAVAARLSAIDAAHADQYQRNSHALLTRLEALDAQLKRRLDGVRRVPYLVFHDAYHYLEARYGLNAIGSITVNPGRKPGARRISEIRQKIAASGARCIFSEPQFSASVTAVISDGFNVKTAVLDPMGAGLASGPELYFELMRNLAASLVGCLGHEGVSGH